jgi:flagellar protein FlaG
MPDPITMTSGMGTMIPAPLVNPQAPAQAARPQAAADAAGKQIQEKTANQPAANAKNGTEAQKADAAAQAQSQAPSKITIEEAVASFKEYLENLPSDLHFRVDKETDRQVFKLVNPITREVVRQFPPEEFLTMVKRLRDVSEMMTSNNGVILDDRF